MVFGEDPRQGYVEADVFYHPTLRFMFPIPKEWTINNMPSQVQMFSKTEDAVIILTLVQADSPAQAVEKFKADFDGVIQTSDALTVNGLTAHKLIANIESEDSQYRLMSYFIEKSDNIYVFHGFTTSNTYSKYTPSFTGTMSGFKTLNDPAKIQVEPDRITIQTVNRRGTLRNVLRRYRVVEDKLEEMAILNGMHLDDQIEANTRLKIIGK